METLNSIYSKTYNFVYLRAKSILQKEEDIQQLMREVYRQAAEQDIRDEKLYEWLGKQTYILGCNKFRKKKVREADYIELEKQEYAASKSVDMEETKKIICETLEELPDMYQATLYAFYYDHMKVKEISAVMGYSVGAIINRLNYMHKYLSRTLENYQEEQKVKVQFSVEAVVAALDEWTKENCMSDNVAQNVFGSLCRDLSVKAEEIETEDNIAGADKRVAKRDADVMEAIAEEFEHYTMKAKKEVKKSWIMIAFVALLALAAVVAIVLMIKTGSGKKKSDKKNPTTQEESQDKETDATEDEAQDGENADEADKSEYILPNSDTVLLTREDLAGLTKEQLRLARNELFARYGVIFGPADLKEYFGSKSWYSEKVSFDEFNKNMSMNDVETANLSLILKVEEEIE